MTAGATVAGAVRLNPATGPGVRIRRVDAPQVVHPGASPTLDVELAGGPADVQVFDGDVLVGEGRVKGRQRPAARRRSRPRTRSPPLHGPLWPKAFASSASAPAATRCTSASTSDRSERAFFSTNRGPPGPAPSSAARSSRTRASTCLRDPRSATPSSVSTGDRCALDAQALAEAAVVLVGAPDLLTAPRSRRSIVLRACAADRSCSCRIARHGPVLRARSGGIQRAARTRPRAIGPLKASEFVIFDVTLDGTSAFRTMSPCHLARARQRPRLFSRTRSTPGASAKRAASRASGPRSWPTPPTRRGRRCRSRSTRCWPYPGQSRA